MNILKTFRDVNVVSLFGEPGMGKSSIAKEMANYIKNRNLIPFSNGVMYFNLD